MESVIPYGFGMQPCHPQPNYPNVVIKIILSLQTFVVHVFTSLGSPCLKLWPFSFHQWLLWVMLTHFFGSTMNWPTRILFQPTYRESHVDPQKCVLIPLWLGEWKWWKMINKTQLTCVEDLWHRVRCGNEKFGNNNSCDTWLII